MVCENEYYPPGPGKILELDKCGQSTGKVWEKKHVPSQISIPNDDDNQLNSIQSRVHRWAFAFWLVFVGHMIIPNYVY